MSIYQITHNSIEVRNHSDSIINSLLVFFRKRPPTLLGIQPLNFFKSAFKHFCFHNYQTLKINISTTHSTDKEHLLNLLTYLCH